MKLRVKETFRDKYTRKVYEQGEIIEVADERAKEMLASPYVVVEEEKKTSTKTDETEKNTKKK